MAHSEPEAGQLHRDVDELEPRVLGQRLARFTHGLLHLGTQDRGAERRRDHGALARESCVPRSRSQPSIRGSE